MNATKHTKMRVGEIREWKEGEALFPELEEFVEEFGTKHLKPGCYVYTGRVQGLKYRGSAESAQDFVQEWNQ